MQLKFIFVIFLSQLSKHQKWHSMIDNNYFLRQNSDDEISLKWIWNKWSTSSEFVRRSIANYKINQWSKLRHFLRIEDTFQKKARNTNYETFCLLRRQKNEVFPGFFRKRIDKSTFQETSWKDTDYIFLEKEYVEKIMQAFSRRNTQACIVHNFSFRKFNTG